MLGEKAAGNPLYILMKYLKNIIQSVEFYCRPVCECCSLTSFSPRVRELVHYLVVYLKEHESRGQKAGSCVWEGDLALWLHILHSALLMVSESISILENTYVFMQQLNSKVGK